MSTNTNTQTPASIRPQICTSPYTPPRTCQAPHINDMPPATGNAREEANAHMADDRQTLEDLRSIAQLATGSAALNNLHLHSFHPESLSNDELITTTESEIRIENEATLKIIMLFKEIYERQLYLPRGFPSLYEMATKHFGYSPGAAMRRINAMKLIRETPEAVSSLQSGELSLSVAADIQSFLFQEKRNGKLFSSREKKELIAACIGKTRREVEIEFVKRSPQREKREHVYSISENRLRVSFSISRDLNTKLNHLKDLLSHIDPAMTTEALIERLCEIGLDKYDPARKAARARRPGQKNSLQAVPHLAFKQSQKNIPIHSAAEACDQKKRHFNLHHGETHLSQKHIRNKEALLASKTSTSAAEIINLTPQSSAPKRSRHIPAFEKHQIEQNGCDYIDSKTGRRCGSNRLLELDHIKPFSLGGDHSAGNLRWLCGMHNRYRNVDPYQRV